MSPAWSDTKAKAEIDRAVLLAKGSDLVVLVLGESANMSGESASRESLEFPGNQEALLESVVAAGKPTVLVLVNGRPLNLQWASQHVPAILEAWYPGTRGGSAVANLLTGDANPSGKLPITWPRDVGQIPIFYAHNTTHEPQNADRRYWDEQSTPMYPFGFGLSYTSFKIANLRLDKSVFGPDDKIKVTVDVTNTGSQVGDEILQIYAHQNYGTASRPVRELKGFTRITLKPAQTSVVSFTLGREELQYWSADSRGWVVDPAKFDLWVGDSSTADLHAQFEIKQ